MLAKTPPMGWNSWNTFSSNVNEALILETADAMIDLGLDKLGYKYVVIDDFWSLKERDPVTDKIVADPERFPHGIKYVADYLHERGLKLGMYSCAGLRTCGGFPGSFDHEFLDAQTFADFGCDLLKYDYCNLPTGVDKPLLYHRMGLALKATGRDIIFSACNHGYDDVYHWIRSAGAHMFRSTGDIIDNFESMKEIALEQDANICYSAPGCFNDLDMLTVGMYGEGFVGSTGCTYTDYVSQFSLWCMFSAPLMLGCDIRKISPEILELITNKNLLRINQDEEARPPVRQVQDGRRVYFKHLSDKEFAICYFNHLNGPIEVPFNFTDFGLSVSSGYGLELRDVNTNEVVGVFKEYYIPYLEAHECKVYLAKLVKV